jgi:GMP synthase (glutamine-hydrolysing)
MAGMRPLGVLVTGDPVENVARKRGSFVDLIRGTLGARPGLAVEVLDARSEPLARLGEFSALVITGSPESVTSRAPWILEAERAVASLARAGLPTLGICFGHQLLAQALGGNVEKNPNGREIGTVAVELLEPDPLFEGAPTPLLANMSHRDSATTLPPGARVLARTKLEPNAAVRFLPRAWGVQFHPEFDGDVMRGYIDARRRVLAEEGIDADGLGASDAPGAAGLLRRFVELAR